MILTIFSLLGLAMGICILYRIFYGIIVLVFNPQQSSFHRLLKMASQLLIAIAIYIICVLLTNSFLAHTNLYFLQFSFGDVGYTIGQRLSGNF